MASEFEYFLAPTDRATTFPRMERVLRLRSLNNFASFNLHSPATALVLVAEKLPAAGGPDQYRQARKVQERLSKWGIVEQSASSFGNCCGSMHLLAELAELALMRD